MPLFLFQIPSFYQAILLETNYQFHIIYFTFGIHTPQVNSSDLSSRLALQFQEAYAISFEFQNWAIPPFKK